jgi:hypothetical protein
MAKRRQGRYTIAHALFCCETRMLTPEQVIARLNQLRKDYDDDKTSEEYQTLTEALLFISYNLAAFKDYLADAAKRAAKRAE